MNEEAPKENGGWVLKTPEEIAKEIVEFNLDLKSRNTHLLRGSIAGAIRCERERTAELLAACKALVSEIEGCDKLASDGPDWPPHFRSTALKLARAAIAKAEGR